MAKFLSLCVVAVALGVALGDVITSPPITDWGNWAQDYERCPEGTLAQGFQVKHESFQGPADDTSMNGLRLFCGNPSDDSTPSITSTAGDWGEWGQRFRCSLLGYITGFALRVEIPDTLQDETATNNIRVFCTNDNEYIEGDGGPYGQWATNATQCPERQAICAIKTQIHPDQGNLRDDTSLNNISFECCPIPTPTKNF